MNWPPKLSSGDLPRNALVRVHPAAWKALIQSRGDLTGDVLIEQWASRHWPLVVRRSMPGEVGGIPVGLPLPPSAGKRRIALQLKTEDIESIAAMPRLIEVMTAAPDAWSSTLLALLKIEDRFHIQTHLVGSLAWQCLTGLHYLTESSDIDLTWSLPRRSCLATLRSELGNVDKDAPMRVDGELVRADGAGVNWRELDDDTAEVLVKTRDSALLCFQHEFLRDTP
ncbi:MAG: malonate decarboxylase holo-[acyl-carrier-protein] synthase [Stenotrophomonas rhizophila]|uniref:malonate decarboxylase holo-[acyl-carrier-protein] synthase n=1 Tax=Stenotrophomonas rhizophila TaxID=216778 RepID=UPI003D12E6CB